MHTAIPDAFRITLSPTAIHEEDAPIIRSIPRIMTAKFPTDPVDGLLVRSQGVMTRVRMVNMTLHDLRINCAELDTLAGTGIIQLATAQAMAREGNNAGARSALSQFRDTVKALRDAYRMILVREDLPGETAKGVLSVAQSLDVTAVQAGIA